MKEYKIITHNKDGKELAEPTMKDLHLYQDVFVKKADGDYRAPIVALADGDKIIVLGDVGYEVEVQLWDIFPILRPLEELKKDFLENKFDSWVCKELGYTSTKDVETMDTLERSCLFCFEYDDIFFFSIRYTQRNFQKLVEKGYLTAVGNTTKTVKHVQKIKQNDTKTQSEKS